MMDSTHLEALAKIGRAILEEGNERNLYEWQVQVMPPGGSGAAHNARRFLSKREAERAASRFSRNGYAAKVVPAPTWGCEEIRAIQAACLAAADDDAGRG